VFADDRVVLGRMDTVGRLDGLSEDEQCACLIAERCIGVEAVAWDVAGRQGAVEAILTYPGGRTAGFEVTKPESVDG
jgi:hypothetical protein